MNANKKSSTSLLRRAQLLFLALAMLVPATAYAQDQGGAFAGDSGPSDDGYVDPGGALPTGAEMSGPRDVFDARARGEGIRIGRSQTRARVIPPTYTVERGDTLWDITGHFYGDPFEWPRVWSYNPEVTNPNWIYPLDQLRLLREGATAAVVPTQRLTRTERPAMGPLEVFLRDEGFLDVDALAKAGELVGSQSDHMLLMTYDRVYIKYRDDVDAPAVGQELSLFHEVAERDRADNETGVLVRIFGTVRVESFDPDEHLARAVITEALDPIERGYHVAAIPRHFESTMPVRNAQQLATTIVATLRPRSLVGENQVIFLGAGSEDGVVVGNRFFIMSNGDSWQETVDANTMDPGNSVPNPRPRGPFPDEVIAEVRVVNVQPHSCAAFVTTSLRETAVGDRAQMRQGY